MSGCKPFAVSMKVNKRQKIKRGDSDQISALSLGSSLKYLTVTDQREVTRKLHTDRNMIEYKKQIKHIERLQKDMRQRRSSYKRRNLTPKYKQNVDFRSNSIKE